MDTSNTKAETMNQAAYQLGRDAGLESDYTSKKERKILLAAAGLDVCEICQDFEAGRREGIQARKAVEQPARDAEAARLDAIRKRTAKLVDAVTAAENHRGEEFHDYAARKRSENLGICEMPAAVATAIREN